LAVEFIFVIVESLSDDTDGGGSRCNCASKHCEWFVFNHEVVIPEYVVDFEYITSVRIAANYC